jgi:hypothetical protein
LSKPDNGHVFYENEDYPGKFDKAGAYPQTKSAPDWLPSVHPALLLFAPVVLMSILRQIFSRISTQEK